MIYRSKAPLRISFCGGGTDVPPYVDAHGGVVLSATINKYAYATLVGAEGRDLGPAEIRSLDYDALVKYDIREEVRQGSQLDLVKAVLRRLSNGLPHRFFLHCDAPPGSGLGSSSTMTVAVVGLLLAANREPYTLYDVARLAYQIERVDLGIKGGRQDQYAATFGGFNLIEFKGDTTVVNPLRVEPWILNELHYSLLLCYTGQTRIGAGIINQQIKLYEQEREETMSALRELKQITYELKDAVLQGRLTDFGRLLDAAAQCKRRMNPATYSERIDFLLKTAKVAGAHSGKILGAGGGGYLLIFCDFDRKHVVARALEEHGGRLVDFEFEHNGLQIWRAPVEEGGSKRISSNPSGTVPPFE